MALGRRAAEKRKRKTGLGLILFFALVFCGVMLYRRVLLEQEEAKVNAAYQTALLSTFLSQMLKAILPDSGSAVIWTACSPLALLLLQIPANAVCYTVDIVH